MISKGWYKDDYFEIFISIHLILSFEPVRLLFYIIYNNLYKSWIFNFDFCESASFKSISILILTKWHTLVKFQFWNWQHDAIWYDFNFDIDQYDAIWYDFNFGIDPYDAKWYDFNFDIDPYDAFLQKPKLKNLFLATYFKIK